MQTVTNQAQRTMWLRYGDFTVDKTPWLRLPFWLRMTIGGTALLLFLGGGTAGVTALVAAETRPARSTTGLAQRPPSDVVRLPEQRAPSVGLGRRPDAGETSTPVEADAAATDERTQVEAADTGTRALRELPGAVVDSIETRTETVTEAIPYRRHVIRDPSMAERGPRVVTPGVEGLRKLVYEVRVTDKGRTRRNLVSSEVVLEPVTEVVAVGPKRSTSG